MSLLTPIKVPVKVYRWDDIGAPILSTSAGSMMGILKACLVTGYGSKAGAGWTVAFEDASAKVFRPVVDGMDTDFYVQCTSDSGTAVKTRVYSNMTDVATGSLIMETETPFVYGFAGPKQWVLLATPRCMWIFIKTNGETNNNRRGAFFTVGDTGLSTNSKKCLFYCHTGGTYGLTTLSSRRSIFENRNVPFGGAHGRAYDPVLGAITVAELTSFFKGMANLTIEPVASQAYLSAYGDFYESQIMGCSTRVNNVFDELQGSNGSFIVVSTGLDNENVALIPTDYWGS